MFPDAIHSFIEKFSRIPSIGPRLATRLALHLASLDKNSFAEISKALNGLGELDQCPDCFSLKPRERSLCDICSSKDRDRTLLAVVEKETDIEAMERSGAYKGLYLAIGEAPHNGVLSDVQRERLRTVKNKITKKERNIMEIIIALPHNSFGDSLAGTIEQGFNGSGPKITRLGRGIPTGGTVEFADEDTLKEALRKRG